MYNFFVNSQQIENDKVKIFGQDAKHISSVLRMKINDEIYISDKDTAVKYLSKITNIQKEEIDCILIKEVESTESNVKVTLFQGLPKADKMEYIIQKSVELGIHEIVPVNMKNCIAKLKDEDKKIQRWQAISEASAKQSKRNIIPKVARLQNIDDISKHIKDFDLVIVAYEDEKKTNLKQLLNKYNKCANIAIVVGPEGGIDGKELKSLLDAGAKTASLGKRILRTETASIAMLSMLIYEYEF